jgi:hypothetical protein
METLKGLLGVAFCVFIGAAVVNGVATVYHDYMAKQAPAGARAAVTEPVKSAPHCSSDHRFEKMEVYPTNLRADIALDSCTGQVCRTWDWTPKNQNLNTPWNAHKYDPLCSTLVVTNP